MESIDEESEAQGPAEVDAVTDKGAQGGVRRWPTHCLIEWRGVGVYCETPADAVALVRHITKRV